MKKKRKKTCGTNQFPPATTFEIGSYHDADKFRMLHIFVLVIYLRKEKKKKRILRKLNILFLKKEKFNIFFR